MSSQTISRRQAIRRGRRGLPEGLDERRRRGAVMEARACLTKALDQLAQCAAGPQRDRKEIAIRLERGFLAGATQGSMSGEGPADFQRAWHWRAPATIKTKYSARLPR